MRITCDRKGCGRHFEVDADIEGGLTAAQEGHRHVIAAVRIYLPEYWAAMQDGEHARVYCREHAVEQLR